MGGGVGQGTDVHQSLMLVISAIRRISSSAFALFQGRLVLSQDAGLGTMFGLIGNTVWTDHGKGIHLSHLFPLSLMLMVAPDHRRDYPLVIQCQYDLEV